MALVATPVLAHGGGDRGACRADVQRLCPDITPGPGSWKSIHDCLTQNAANLSAACQQQRSKMQAKMDQALQACQADIQMLCANAGSDPHATFKCLFQNRADLSQACRDALPHHRHHGPCTTPTPSADSAE
jgi:hypothetical protein